MKFKFFTLLRMLAMLIGMAAGRWYPQETMDQMIALD